MLRARLAADLGGRFPSQTVGRAAAFAPRFGIAYSPGKDRKTILRAGTGIFYDRVPLLAADLTGNPTRVITQYDPRGRTTSNEVVFENEYITNGSAPIASRIRHAPNTSARSFVSSIEVDRALWTGAVLRLSYVHSTTRNLFVISPFGGEGGAPGVLGLLNTGKENHSQTESTLRFHPVKDGDLSISYFWTPSPRHFNPPD